MVRRKITSESSGDLNTQQSASITDTSGSSTGLMKKEVPSQTSTSPSGASSKMQSSSNDPATALLASKDTSAIYRYRGLLDPFLPLIKEEKSEPPPAVASSEKPQTKKRVPRTPLEKIDLSQLTLTAVFRSQKRTTAMVEESTGKGYLVRKGTYIGLDGGRITKVLKDRILISEVSEDVMGKPVTVERELKLRQFSGE